MNIGEKLSFLLDRYVNDSCSIEELNELLMLIDNSDHQQLVQRKLKEIWDNTNPLERHTDKEWEFLYAAMMKQTEERETPVRKLLIWRKIAVAAVILISLTAGLLLYTNRSLKHEFTDKSLVNIAHQLPPGGNKAILTLANGSKIVLDGNTKGVIASQTGVQITKAANGQLIYTLQNIKAGASNLLSYNTIETPKGGQYQISMPDGTRVWLNAMSSLKYPVAFKGKERRVELNGEAYFEVAKNKNAPFKVVSGNQEVEVLGTHFNINSYTDEKGIQTTLLEGAVKVLSRVTGETAMLVPGQQSVIQANAIAVKSVDTELAVAWKNGNFTFNKDHLDHIMKELARWYDVDIVYQDEQIKKQVFSGSVSRFENASQVLDILELTGLVHFKIEGRRITVM